MINRIKLAFSVASLFMTSLVMGAQDVDLDDDGVIDSEYHQSNLLVNNNFSSEFEGWQVSNLTIINDLGYKNYEGPVASTANTTARTEGYLTQTLVLSQLGFSNRAQLDDALASNAMKVVFGGWALGNDKGNSITVTFLDKEGVVIDEGIKLSDAAPDAWLKREAQGLIPEGTYSINYRVDLVAYRVYHGTKFDDAFLYIQVADDSDVDDVLDSFDIDNNNDGLVDADKADKNLLINPDFTDYQSGWTVSNLTMMLANGPTGLQELIVGTTNTTARTEGYLTQTLVLSQLGFSNRAQLDDALASNAMKVVFGGWALGNDKGNSITVTFLDKEGVVIDEGIKLSDAAPDAWLKREAQGLIPEGTYSINYRVDLGSYRVYHGTKFDDAFLYIQVADDSDVDDVLDSFDIDNNNDGLVDADKADKNLLINPDFTDYQSGWTVSNLTMMLANGPTGLQELIVGTTNTTARTEGYLTQTLVLSQLGFSNRAQLDDALASNAMKVVFGGWALGNDKGNSITVTFLDKEGVVIDEGIKLSDAAPDAWLKREAQGLIPEGTYSINYRVDLGSYRVYHGTKFDDAFLYIQVADDSDVDDVLDSFDIDNNNDGLVDADKADKNLLINPDFTDYQSGWTVSNLTMMLANGPTGLQELIVGTTNTTARTEGYLTQTLVLSQLGFSNRAQLDDALASNAMKVVFGGWALGNDKGNSITVTFLDKEGVVIDEGIKLSDAAPDAWLKREAQGLIPEGTYSINYRVDLVAYRVYHGTKFDDAFLYIQVADDSDVDDVLDSFDIDNNNDGLVDADKADKNLLINPDFTDYQSGWTVSNLTMMLANGPTGLQELIVGTTNTTARTEGYLTQTLVLSQLGFSNRAQLDDALASNAMKVVFGGWALGNDKGNSITVTFLDKEGVVIDEGIKLSDAAPDAWLKREAQGLIPEGTYSINYRVDLGSYRVYHGTKFDDAFLYIYDLSDSDNDGISNSEEYLKGTSPTNPDSDGDGVWDGSDRFPLDSTDWFDSDNDGIGNNADLDDDNDGVSDLDEIKFGLNPLNPNDAHLAPANLLRISSDYNADGVSDWLSYKQSGSSITFEIFDGYDFASLTKFELTHPFLSVSVELLKDRNLDNIQEIGLFGLDKEIGRYQLHVYHGATGESINTWNWPNTLNGAQFKAIQDLTSDGVEEYAITGIHALNGSRQLVVKDGVTQGTYQTFKWVDHWAEPQIVVMSDRTYDSIPEIALYGRHKRMDKGQLFVLNGAYAGKLDVYNWNKLWTELSLHEMDDLDGDGTIDWGQFGTRKDDGRYQWVVKKGHDKRGVIRTFSWPNDLTEVKPLLIADRTGDGVREVSVYGKSDDGRVYLRVNDGRLANTRIANFSWPAMWQDEEVMELGDLNNDGYTEVGLLGVNKNSGVYQLIIKDGFSTVEYGRLTLDGEWAKLTIHSYDVNSDGFADVMVNGIEKSTLSRKVSFYSGSNLSMLHTVSQ
ncbi:hypothetical protein [Pseudoalteromonas lipolytica]